MGPDFVVKVGREGGVQARGACPGRVRPGGPGSTARAYPLRTVAHHLSNTEGSREEAKAREHPPPAPFPHERDGTSRASAKSN